MGNHYGTYMLTISIRKGTSFIPKTGDHLHNVSIVDVKWAWNCARVAQHKEFAAMLEDAGLRKIKKLTLGYLGHSPFYGLWPGRVSYPTLKATCYNAPHAKTQESKNRGH